MKQNKFQQEVLVLTGSSIARKALIGHNGGRESAVSNEDLEKGFWNGLLNMMLPKFMLPLQGRRSELFIWQIRTGATSLLIDMGQTPQVMEESFSINPGCFLSRTRMN